ncbi:hypothetical protein JHK85_045390 [Glycine max]|nr:hypothetical protein JHK85_045390 [Glycine max]
MEVSKSRFSLSGEELLKETFSSLRIRTPRSLPFPLKFHTSFSFKSSASTFHAFSNVEEDKEDDEEEDQDPPNVLGECQGRFRRAVDPPKVEDKIGVVPHGLSTNSDVVKRVSFSSSSCGKNLQMEEMKVASNLLVGDPASLEKKIDAIRFGGP